MLTAYKRSIANLNFYGVPHRTFINAEAEMVIRYNEYGADYTEEVYAPNGSLLRVVDVQDGYKHIQGGER